MPEARKKLKEKEEKGKGIEKEKKSTDDQKGKDVRKRDLENLSKDEEENQTPKKEHLLQMLWNTYKQRSTLRAKIREKSLS